MKINIKKLYPDVILPEYKTIGSSGADIHAYTRHINRIGSKHDKFLMMPGDIFVVPTGISMSIPVGSEAQVRPRSGLSKKGIVVAFGTIDSDFRDEIKVILINLSGDYYYIKHGDRIAQLVIAPVELAEWNVVDKLDETERGSGGFGSTGK